MLSALLFLAGGLAGSASSTSIGTREPPKASEGVLQRRAALIYLQHVAVSLLHAREQGLSPAEQGRRVGAVFAGYKSRHSWHRSERALRLNALAKLMDEEYELSSGRATFTLRSRYGSAERVLEGYDLGIEDYVAWLEALHEVIGAFQGYAMTARLEDGWLVERYEDLPPRQNLVPAPDLPRVEMGPEELRRYAGYYVGGAVTADGDPDSGDERVLRVWEEAGRLRAAGHKAGELEGRGGYLIPLGGGRFAPGWYPEEGPPEVQPDVILRFSLGEDGRATVVEVEQNENVKERLERSSREEDR